MKRLSIILGIAIVVASCNAKYDKTPSGLAYKVIKGDGKQKLKAGDILKINLLVKLTPKDSVLFTTYGRLPEYMPFDTTTRKSHDFTEVLKFCSVGDSMVAVSQIDTLVKMGGLTYSDAFKKGGQITFYVRILKAYSSQQEAMTDRQAEFEKERSREIAELENTIKKKGVKAQKTANGAFVETTSAGDTAKVQPGKYVTVMYKGSLLSNGKVFDTNMDPSFGHPEPYSFVLGAGQTIPGWEEGLPYFSKGSKGKIYIPSMLAYGPAGQGPQIPPYSSLVFEVEVRDVKDAPKQQQMPPGADPRQQMQGDPQQQQGNPQQSQGSPQQQQNAPH
jgi:FKBP-type peptidyl-prolyl cis-trans isomerase FkpA